MSKSRHPWVELTRNVVRGSGLANSQIARDARLSRAALHAWMAGRRVPRGASLLRLAAGLERRAERLRELAGRLRSAAGGQRAGSA